MKDFGKFKYFLGIEVACSKDGIFISQKIYHGETRLLGGRTIGTPLEPNLKLGKSDIPVVDRGRYQRLVGG